MQDRASSQAEYCAGLFGIALEFACGGEVRNVRLYKKNLNALAIIKEMNATKTVSRPPLKGKKTQ